MFMFKFMFKIKFKIKVIISSWILLAYSVIIINIVFLYKLVALLVEKLVEELLVFFIEY